MASAVLQLTGKGATHVQEYNNVYLGYVMLTDAYSLCGWARPALRCSCLVNINVIL